MIWQFYGPHALLIYFAKSVGDLAFERGRALAEYLERDPVEGLVEFVFGFTSVLLEFDKDVELTPAFAAKIVGELESVSTTCLPPGPIHDISVFYDGPDVERVARHNGLSVEEMIRLHSETIYKVYFLGFAPGFPYLGDLNPKLHTPRLSSPRQRVPAGSVAIGGEHTGVYSVETPGGWNIIGHTTLKLFDPDKAASGNERAAFCLQQGDRVKFVVQD